MTWRHLFILLAAAILLLLGRITLHDRPTPVRTATVAPAPAPLVGGPIIVTAKAPAR